MNKNGVHIGPESERESIKRLLGDLVSHVSTIVRGEIALAIQSLQEKISDISDGLLMLGGALFIGFVAFFSLSAAVVIKLSETMSVSAAVFLVGAILAVIAILLASFGCRKIKPSVD